MRRHWSRRALLAGLAAGLAGCSGSPSGSAETPSVTSTPTRTPVEVRSFPDGYYQGPLVSAHEHMNGPDGSARRTAELEQYAQIMNRNRVDRVMAITPPQLFEHVEKFTDSLIPFLFGGPFLNQHPDDFAGRMQQSFEANDLLRGFGEIGLYSVMDSEGLPSAPDMPQLLDLYDFAADQGAPVMIHGAEPWNFPDEVRQSWDSPLECPTIEQMATAYEHNRDTQFLVHGTYFNTGEMTSGEMAARALEHHPNLYFDISKIAPFAYHPTFRSEEQLTRSEFDALIEEKGVEGHAQEFYEEYAPVLEDYSDRVLWGMDAGKQWNFTQWALDTWIDIGRAVLGKLSTEDARNVGFRTAEELFDIEVTMAVEPD